MFCLITISELNPIFIRANKSLFHLRLTDSATQTRKLVIQLSIVGMNESFRSDLNVICDLSSEPSLVSLCMLNRNFKYDILHARVNCSLCHNIFQQCS